MRNISLLALALLAACTTPASNAPSLAPRAAEAIDPRLPIADTVPAGPASAALVARLDALVAQAQAGDAAFRPVADEAERMAAAAGGQQSESWIAAQQALSAAVAARAPVTTALGDIDALGSTELETKGGVAPADQAAIAAAAARVGTIDRRQAALIERLQRRLGG